LDLHFTDHWATDEERAAVDALLGPPASAWEGGERHGRDTRLAEGGREARCRRHLLLPALQAVQARTGWISPGALNYLSRRLTVPPAEAYGVATFYALLATEPQPAVVAHVCDDIACKCRGADALCAELESRFGPPGTPCGGGRAAWKRSPCLGLCDLAPAAFVQAAGPAPEEFTLAPVDAASLSALLTGQGAGGGRRGVPANASTDGSTPLLRRVGIVDPSSLDAYRASGGWRALRRALEMGPEGILREVRDAELTGRGGAAFPTGVKWRAVAQAPVRPHYVVCNADESEPGTFKDRVLMEGDPFALVEAMTIAGLACGAEQGFIYLRGEYPEAARVLQGAVEEARNRGLLGQDILGRGVRFDLEIRRGAGAYICGEETALLNSIEGRRGEPRNKPPFPVQHGLFGKPTVINNVETLVNVLHVLENGGSAYRSLGTEKSTGTRLFCLSGCVERPGVYELTYGATLRSALDMAGGVRGGRALQAVLLGGAAGVFLRPDEIDLPLTLEGAREADATLGSGVILVFDDSVDLRAILLRIAAFFRDESCGQCVPCRVGTVRQEEALRRLLSGAPPEEEIALLADLDRAMKDASICGLGHTAGSAIASAIHRLRLLSHGTG